MRWSNILREDEMHQVEELIEIEATECQVSEGKFSLSKRFLKSYSCPFFSQSDCPTQS